MESREGRVLTVALAIVLVVYGAIAINTHSDGSFRSWALWVSALLGSAAMVVGGLLVRPTHLHLGTALIVVGSILAIIPTMWTIALPILELSVIALALRDHSRAALPV